MYHSLWFGEQAFAIDCERDDLRVSEVYVVCVYDNQNNMGEIQKVSTKNINMNIYQNTTKSAQ